MAATQQVHCKFPYIGAAALTAVHIPLISGTECLLQETGLTLCEELMIAVCTPMLRPLSTTYSGTDSPKHISRMQLQDSAHCCCGDGVCGCLSAADTAAGTCPKEGNTLRMSACPWQITMTCKVAALAARTAANSTQYASVQTGQSSSMIACQVWCLLLLQSTSCSRVQLRGS